MNSPVIAGMKTAKRIANKAGYAGKVLRQLFELDWTYEINTTDALADYGTKAEAFKAWKRGWQFKG